MYSPQEERMLVQVMCLLTSTKTGLELRVTAENITQTSSVSGMSLKTSNFRLIPYYYFWVGLYRTRSWSDQSNSSFSNWRTGQPDNAGNSEYCTAVSFRDSGSWTDENCNTALPFICYSGEYFFHTPTESHHKHRVHSSDCDTVCSSVKIFSW